jgi:hypothetical protein
MRGIALLTTLAMTAGTAAVYADPPRVEVRVERDRDAGWTRDHYDRYNDSHWSHDFRGRWMSLGQGSTQGQRQFNPPRAGRLNKLRVEAVRGAPAITSMTIEFADGSTQAVNLDMRLQRGGGEVIDLNGRNRKVFRVIVYPDPRTRGTYSLYGA